MAEDEAIFDPSLKKKKKKKKTPFDLEAVVADEAEQPAAEPVPQRIEVPDWGDKGMDTGEKKSNDKSFEEEFALGKKKKKKKAFNLDILEDNLPDDNETDGRVESAPKIADDDDLDFSNMKKKKKTKKRNIEFADEADIFGESKENNMSSTVTSSNKWADTDRDYTYEELLQRVFAIMTEKNPDIVAGEKKRFVMKPPQIMRVGAKKSAFANFADICKLLHRQPKHLLAYLLAELGTSGSIDGSNQLIIKGRFQQKQIERVLRGYIKEYVTCHTCRSPDTILQKDTRLFFLQCETCHSRCSVASIKSGFQAVTGKRAAIRAKTA